MADLVAGLGHWLDILLSYLRAHGVNGLDAVFYIFGVTIFVVLGGAIHSVGRTVFLRCSVRKSSLRSESALRSG